MNLFSVYELYDEFTLHDVSYLLCGHEPLSPGPAPVDDPHEIIRHRAYMLGRQLINDAMSGKLRATKRDIGDSWELAGAPQWIVTRNDLKDWANRKMIRPPFLFPQLPLLDTVRNLATAEAYKLGTESHVVKLAYSRALLRIAQQINNAQLTAYLPDANGEFAKLSGDHGLVLQMRNFLAEGIKSEERHQYGRRNLVTGDRNSTKVRVPINMEWTERIYIPTEVVPTAKQPAEPEKLSSRVAKQEGRLRRDILDSAIDKAIKNAGNEEPAAVFVALRELALKGEALPFNGLAEGPALLYTDAANKVVPFTKDALSKRLKRRRLADTSGQ